MRVTISHSYFMGVTVMGTLTIRLDDKADRKLSRLAKRMGKTRSEIVREALRSFEIRARLDTIRRELVPKAEAIGWLTRRTCSRMPRADLPGHERLGRRVRHPRALRGAA